MRFEFINISLNSKFINVIQHSSLRSSLSFDVKVPLQLYLKMSVKFRFQNIIYASILNCPSQFDVLFPLNSSTACCHMSSRRAVTCPPQRAVTCPPLLVRVTLALIGEYFPNGDQTRGPKHRTRRCSSLLRVLEALIAAFIKQ